MRLASLERFATAERSMEVSMRIGDVVLLIAEESTARGFVSAMRPGTAIVDVWITTVGIRQYAVDTARCERIGVLGEGEIGWAFLGNPEPIAAGPTLESVIAKYLAIVTAAGLDGCSAEESDLHQEQVWLFVKAVTAQEAWIVWGTMSDEQKHCAELQLGSEDAPTMPSIDEMMRQAVAWHLSMNPPTVRS